ncbi:acyl--CoA ligase [Streptomyces sp. NBC_01498]|uniref:class I adenylate-forming enzyme family protein n=1 Tax=Streptomyces sp. NBC_01498 TaxID=2975870 RepID=UPI002E7B5989|nr:class I adenylate-forming enzyme family protein [Streptomyces sp. NBC_01498]WTL24871.1 acyl--CoA ligase [Streptomyces sp. NBC_01498]
MSAETGPGPNVFRAALLSALAAGGGRPAVIEDDTTRSYADLDRWSSDLARRLRRSAARSADRPLARPVARPPQEERPCAALLLPNGASWLAAYLAVLKADMVAVPLNYALTGAEIGRVLEHTRPRVVLCAPEREPEMRELVAVLSPTGAQPQVRTVGPVPPAVGTPTEATSLPRAERGPEAPCLVMHTSGTTGRPKALVQTEHALHLTTGHWRLRHRTPDDVVALPIPLAHTYGHLVAAATLLAGAALIAVPEAFDPQRWVARLTRHRATVLEGVPALYARLLTADAPAVSGGSLRRCLSAGQEARAELRRSWEERTGVPLLESWGMTELAGPGLDPLPGTCRGSAGTPVPGLETRLVFTGAGGTGPGGAGVGGTGPSGVGRDGAGPDGSGPGGGGTGPGGAGAGGTGPSGVGRDGAGPDGAGPGGGGTGPGGAGAGGTGPSGVGRDGAGPDGAGPGGGGTAPGGVGRDGAGPDGAGPGGGGTGPGGAGGPGAGGGAGGTAGEPGTAGELWVRGPQVTPGHRTGTGALVPVCDERGWLRTGDLAVRDEHGCVTLTGRLKDVITTRGYTVHPAEIEAALREHPGVADVAVVGRADPERGEAPHAVVVAHRGRPAVPVAELREHCRGLLARHKVPRTMEFVPRLPVSATGKLDRAALRGPAATAVEEG